MGVPGVIRASAFCFVQEEDRLLFARFIDPDDGSHYYRPLGGGIKFGETGEQAVRRELREELGVELAAVRFIGFFENLFEMRNEQYHELCLVFVAEPDGWSIDRFDGFAIPESVGPGSEETAIIRSIGEIDNTLPLYPVGLLELAKRL